LNLDLFSKLLNNTKEENSIKNFVKELTDCLEKTNEKSSNNFVKEDSLKKEDCLYQVVELVNDGAYLQNTTNNQIQKETDIPKNILDNIGNDFVLRYQDGKYVIEEELTQKFFDSLVGIKEYEEIENNFIKESGILEIEPNTKFKIETKDKDYCILSYGDNAKNTIKVPNVLIPFWANIEENLYYKDGKFDRDL
jgi:hypothetical protein